MYRGYLCNHTIFANLDAIHLGIDFALDRFKVAARTQKLVHFLRPHSAAAESRVLNQLGELFGLVDDKQRRDALKRTE